MHSDMYHIGRFLHPRWILLVSTFWIEPDMFYTWIHLKVEAAPKGVTPMLLYIQALSYLHISGPLPDSPERRGDLVLCTPYKIFRPYTIRLIYILTGHIDSVLKVQFKFADCFKCESTQVSCAAAIVTVEAGKLAPRGCDHDCVHSESKDRWDKTLSKCRPDLVLKCSPLVQSHQ